MTDTASPAEKPALGAGRLLSESISLYFNNFLPMSVVVLIPILLVQVVSLAMLGTPDPADPWAYYNDNAVMIAISSLLGLAAWGFCSTAVTALAYDAKVGNPIRIGTGISAGLKNLLVVTVLMLVVSICWVIGFALLIIPGMIVAAMWVAVVPVVVVENAGFGALGRSARLTKEYRWPIIGLLGLFFLVLFVASLAVGLVTALLAFGTIAGNVGGGFGTGVVIELVVNVLFSTVLYGVSGAMVALVYARLVEIKEGRSLSSLAEVFS